MGRRSRLLFAAGAAVVLMVSGIAQAGVPDPLLSSAPNVIVSPDGLLTYTVTVIGADGPIDSALVQLIFSDEADSLMCWCSGATTHPVIESMTDAAGEANFNIEGGGCIDPTALSGGVAVEVYANGISLDQVAVVSPDAVDPGGNKATAGWNPGGICDVGLSDATFHTGPISTGSYELCTDVDSSGDVGLADAVIYTDPIAAGASCTQE